MLLGIVGMTLTSLGERRGGGGIDIVGWSGQLYFHIGIFFSTYVI